MNEAQRQYYSDFVKAVRAIDMDDHILGHAKADDIVIEFLRHFDYPDLANAYEKIAEKFGYS